MKYGYHSTDANPEKIKLEGFNSDNPSAVQWGSDGDKLDKFKQYGIQIPKNPCWIFNAKVGSGYAGDNDYCLKIDITGLKLWPDLNFLPEADEDGNSTVEISQWFKKSYSGLATYLEKNAEKMTLDGKQFYKFNIKDISGEDCFKYAGSAVIDGDKVKDRIVAYQTYI